MDDLTITCLCAEAMGLELRANKVIRRTKSGHPFPAKYDPLHDDAQAMALVKKFELRIGRGLPPENVWHVEKTNHFIGRHESLNYAICECVAKMQQAKGGEMTKHPDCADRCAMNERTK